MLEFFSDPNIAKVLPTLPQEIWETLYSTIISTLAAYAIGLPLGVILVTGEKGGVLELHLRDDATTFNPFALDTSRASRDEDFDMDGMGVLVIKKRAKEFSYRRYQGFNTLIIKI